MSSSLTLLLSILAPVSEPMEDEVFRCTECLVQLFPILLWSRWHLCYSCGNAVCLPCRDRWGLNCTHCPYLSDDILNYFSEEEDEETTEEDTYEDEEEEEEKNGEPEPEPEPEPEHKRRRLL